jgi:hypothetical protein
MGVGKVALTISRLQDLNQSDCEVTWRRLPGSFLQIWILHQWVSSMVAELLRLEQLLKRIATASDQERSVFRSENVTRVCGQRVVDDNGLCSTAADIAIPG